MTDAQIKKVCQNFEIPAQAVGLLDFFFEPEELDLILNNGGKTFTAKEIGSDFAARQYCRGVISKTDETGKTYRLNTFYYFLDVFAVGRREKYQTLPTDTRRKLDDWYFDAYMQTLDSSSDAPTSDKVLPLSEMLEKIDSDDRPVYLNWCDCRTLTGECGLPTRTCITYKNGINSFADRGLSEQIDKERAKEIVIETDKAGLMHTSAMGGICNCCGDCCYLFRAQKRLKSVGKWPASDYMVHFSAQKCVLCGKCIVRCHFGVFERENGKIRFNPEGCVGCGLCVNTCPKAALSLIDRNTQQ
ncbi:MAG: 4Fe-4S dicluster domain-containing protein [Clostridia bacterium]|nr:4Fe-4S dicluster domain-containing protein [Clostridia bacterium]